MAREPNPEPERLSFGELVYRLAVLSGWCRLQRRRDRAPVFCFHNVVDHPVRAGEPSLHVPCGVFETYMRWVSSTYRVVPLSEICNRLAGGRSVQGLAAVTFDDAYRGVFRNAVPILRSLGIPATVFVVTDASTNPTPFWWDVLAGSGHLSDRMRSVCMIDLLGDRDACLRVAGIETDPILDPDLLPASWEEIAKFTDVLDIGSHTVTHRNLTRLGLAELEVELTRSRNLLVDRFQGAGTIISYPYGLVNDDVMRAARRAGYSSGVSLRNRTIAPAHDPFDLPRINVPTGISRARIECRAADIARFKR